MAMYERVRAAGTDLWAAEICGCQICIRSGKAGGKGRITSIVTASEADAEARFAEEVAHRRVEGFELVDELAGISGLFRSRAQREQTRGRSAAVTPGVILARLETRIGSARSLEELAELVCAAAAEPCAMRLGRLDLSLREGERGASFEVDWLRGRGDNPDDFEHEGGRVSFRFAEPWARADDGVTLDVLVEPTLRSLSSAALVAKFRHALRQLPDWARSLGCAAVADATMDR